MTFLDCLEETNAFGGGLYHKSHQSAVLWIVHTNFSEKRFGRNQGIKETIAL